MSSNPMSLDTSLDELRQLYALADHCRNALRADFRNAAHMATMLREAIRKEIYVLEKARAARELEPLRKRAKLRVVT